MSIQYTIFLKKAYTAGFLLSGRRVLTQVIVTASNLILARLLIPSDFGTYALIIYTMTLFSVFADLGLGPALVQKTDISKTDISSAFTTLCLLAIVLMGLVFVGSPLFATFFELSSLGTYLLRLQALTFLFLPFKTIGIALLERNLQYKNLTVIEIAEQLTISLITIYLAYRGAGAFSFVVGNIVGTATAALLYYVLLRWSLILKLSTSQLKSLLHFGIPVQSTVFLGLFYGPLIYLYMGKIVSETEVGYFQLAAGLAVFPLFFSEIIARIMFPLVARTAQDLTTVGKLYIGSFAVTALLTLPVVTLCFVLAQHIVIYLYGPQWLPIVPGVRLLFINTSILAFTTISTQVLLALGDARWVRKMNLVWVGITWIVAPTLIGIYGFLGMIITMILVSFSGMLMVYKLKQKLEVSLIRRLMPVVVAAVLSGVMAVGISTSFTLSLESLLGTTVLCLGFYMLLVRIFAKDVLFQTIKPLSAALLGAK